MAFQVPEITDEDRLWLSDAMVGPSGCLEGEVEEAEDALVNETSQPLNSLSNLPNHPDRLERPGEQFQQETVTAQSAPAVGSCGHRN